MGGARAALRRAGDRPERLGAGGVRRLGELYRAAAADLAFARRRSPAIRWSRGWRRSCCAPARRSTRASGRRASLWHFFTRGYWRRLAERPRLVLAAWALLLVPAVAGARLGRWSTRRPPRA